MEEIMNMIANQGFAIVAAVGVFIAYYKTTQNHTAEIQRLNELHATEMKTYIEQLNRNTEQLQATNEVLRSVMDEIHALRQ